MSTLTNIHFFKKSQFSTITNSSCYNRWKIRDKKCKISLKRKFVFRVQFEFNAQYLFTIRQTDQLKHNKNEKNINLRNTKRENLK